MAAPALSAKLDLMAVLEDRGHRSTVPRREVISAIESKVDSFTAEEISDALPAVGRATVFRTIKLLLEAGVLCKRALPDGAPTYVVARIEHHHHTICARCGQVVEFRDATIERLMRALGERVEGEIVGHRIEFYITCGSCLGQDGSRN